MDGHEGAASAVPSTPDPRSQMTRTKPLLAGVAAAVAVATALLGGVLADDSPSGRGFADRPTAAVQADRQLLDQLLRGIAREDTRSYVRRLERRLAGGGGDADTLTLLGFAYQQRARETADPTYFGLSEQALRRAGRAGADAGLITTGLASLAVSRHRFGEALVLARDALRSDPQNATAYGALGDALANLGRYREAFKAFDRMAELSPSIASYARIAQARELLGRPGAAAEAASLALELSTEVPEHVAATHVQLGNIHFNAGRLADAHRAYSEALEELPGYLRAEAGLARVEAASGRYGPAAERLQRVVSALPFPEYAILLGDTLRAAGRPAAARRAYGLVQTIERLLEANGVRTELQTALFDLDHGRRLADALGRSRLAHRASPSIQSADVLAWALLRNGRCSEAQPYSRQALRLGTQDALAFFHRGMIERCLARRDTARASFRRALEINPYFSLLWAPVARRYVA
jgi:tetratricopeptide (TPR) repeat protein